MLIDTTGSNAGLAMLLEAFRGKFALAGQVERETEDDTQARRAQGQAPSSRAPML